MRKNSSCHWHRLQEITHRTMVCDLKMFMFCSNYKLLQARRSNYFACHSGVLKSTFYENDPVVSFNSDILVVLSRITTKPALDTK